MANQGRRWFEQRKEFVAHKRSEGGAEVPDLFTRCPACHEPLFNEVLAANGHVCTMCGHHLRIDATTRIKLLCDAGPLEVHDDHLLSVDPLHFVDSKPYGQRVAASRKKAGCNDAFLAVSSHIHQVPVEIGSFEFAFMGGSMGSVVGETITRLFERAAERERPAIVVSASGGARMQEGVLSLMQMAKTCAALARLQDRGLPYISVLTHPTTGGVAASFAMLGDIILAEPEALIGFAGPRVIEQTIGQQLPDDFQTSEYLLDHGMVDRIVRRGDMRDEIGILLRQFLGLPALPRAQRPANRASDDDPALREGTDAKLEGSSP
ncbi:MAG: acetyl-CoA carboxylase carboxyltransferase subunit beta [Deltaproteobacteria bacterium]|nr:MAG: acetyl-CoA carboxylase carboxyltransferase subunit beta [Deltaproteobacteria bacterium]